MTPSASHAGPSPGLRSIPNLRWWIVGILFLSTVINYVDRQTLSVLARTIQDDLGISDSGYARIVQAFLLAYTISYLVSGRITDWLGTRVSMAAFIVWWSLANIGTAFASSIFTLGLWRLLLGVGEPGNWTVGPKALSEWFPARERGLAYGIFTMGATIGATVAPPLIAWLALSYGWRGAFVVTGVLGLLWVIPWLWLYRPPHEHPRLTDAERVLVPPAPTSTTGGAEWTLWRTLLTQRDTWLLLGTRVLTDPVWYFYLFWFPKYLTDTRGLSLIEVGRVAWVVYLAADLGALGGGWLSGRLIDRGYAPVAARKLVLRIAATTILVGPLVAWAPSIPLVLLCAAVVACSQLAWQVTIGALIVDRYPPASVATAFGIVAAGSGFGGMVSTGVVGYLVSNYSYVPVFVTMALLHPLALALVWFLRGDRTAEGAAP
ncbi:Hexuronate transporter [Luteitalea pratensis]|uniref:Hexuronate transporter n=1 Tax=Luteitalea pratensis TaxID=1855912 RepID=A0A143PMJ7_LUTPR|nr:MFS transporter [Luteitalea pratensis]AMY09433.1 Hexuronate transporter [Luteitalea pratensis]